MKKISDFNKTVDEQPLNEAFYKVTKKGDPNYGKKLKYAAVGKIKKYGDAVILTVDNGSKLYKIEDVEKVNESTDEFTYFSDLDEAVELAFADFMVEAYELTEDDVPQQVNEAAGVAFVISILMSAPKLVQMLGRLVATISSLFRKKKVTGDNAIIKFGEKMESKFIGAVAFILRISGIAKRMNLDTKEKRIKVATLIYYTVLAAAAVKSGASTVAGVAKSLLTGKGKLADRISDIGDSAADASGESIDVGDMTNAISALVDGLGSANLPIGMT